MARTTVALPILCALVACSEPGQVTRPLKLQASTTCDEDFARLQTMEAEILALIGDPLCSAGSECAAVPFGSKPCGGAWRYLVYSTGTVDEAALRQKVDEYNALNAVLNKRCGVLSDCMLVVAPQVGCVADKCVALMG